jgi:hypothetical protein
MGDTKINEAGLTGHRKIITKQNNLEIIGSEENDDDEGGRQ